MKKKHIIFSVIVVLLGSLLFGCANNANDAVPQSKGGTSYYSDMDLENVTDSGLYAPSAYPEAAPEVATPNDPAPDTSNYGGHKVIRSFNIEVQTASFNDHLATIMQNLESNGGYAATANISGREPEVYGDAGRTAYLVMKVPAENADAFMGSVKQIGILLESSESAEDITAQYYDIETRLDVLRTQLERLKSILVTSDNLADIIQLESEIARITLEIESLTTQLRRYDGLVDYSTITLHLYEESQITGPSTNKDTPTRMQEGFTNTLHGVGAFFEELAVWLVSALPVLVLLVVVMVVIILCVKASRKKKHRRNELPDAKAEEALDVKKEEEK